MTKAERRLYMKQWRIDNRERIKEYNTQWRIDNAEHIKDKNISKEIFRTK